MTASVVSADLNDAIQALSTAAALGIELDAPAGLHVYQVSAGWLSEDPDLIGIFATEEDAYDALRNHLLAAQDLGYQDADGHGFGQEAPDWTGARSITLREWLAERSSRDVVAAYYKFFFGEHYEIERIQIQGTQEQLR